jgi:hypothetical protein
MAVSLVGEEGRFLPHERMLLEAGLPALLSRLRLRTLEAVGGIAAPAAAAAAVVSWGLRVAAAAAKRARERRSAREPEAPQGEGEAPAPVSTENGDYVIGGGNEWLWRNVRSI